MIDTRFRELVLIRESLRAVEVIEYIHDTSPVPIIRHSTTVVDVAGSVLQYLLAHNIQTVDVAGSVLQYLLAHNIQTVDVAGSVLQYLLVHNIHRNVLHAIGSMLIGNPMLRLLQCSQCLVPSLSTPQTL